MTLLTRRKFTFLLLSLAASACRPVRGFSPTSESIDPSVPTLALTNAALIDGTGSGRVSKAVVLIQGEKIKATGDAGQVAIPRGAQIVDLGGATILPGFINAHVHDGFDPANLKAWAQAGVTTVRDMGVRSAASFPNLMTQRAGALNHPEYARVISAGSMMTVKGGYGNLIVEDTSQAACKAAVEELDQGADLIKISREDGYAGVHGMPKMSDAVVRALVELAHQRGTQVAAHITQARYLEEMVASGVDDIAHTPYDQLSDDAIQKMVAQGISMNTTFSVLQSYNAIGASVDNLMRFAKAGGRVVFGNDHNGGPNRSAFELGMPMFEVEKMQEAGMAPLQIITAATKTTAEACNRPREIGTVEPGKSADLLIVDGDPLRDLQALKQVKMVFHRGTIIRGDSA